ncbi:MAG TPA: hypothetical protein PLF13_13230 [candidate division Zixibacteria bacterium]|nr:hypothetical protein [candidate division Zixibacteria bacterium]
MTDQPINPVVQPKKGMSTGLKVTLIVIGAIIVLIVAMVIYCVSNLDKLAAVGAKTIVKGIQSELIAHPVEGVDVDRYNRVTKVFIEKIDQPDQNPQELALFVQQAGESIKEQPYTADDIERLVQAMIQLYPELAEVAGPAILEIDTTLTADSTVLLEETTVDE